MEGRDKTQIIVSKLQKSTTPSKSARLIIDGACKVQAGSRYKKGGCRDTGIAI